MFAAISQKYSLLHIFITPGSLVTGQNASAGSRTELLTPEFASGVTRGFATTQVGAGPAPRVADLGDRFGILEWGLELAFLTIAR